MKSFKISKYVNRKCKLKSSIDSRTGLNNVRQYEFEFNRIVIDLINTSLIAMI